MSRWLLSTGPEQNPEIVNNGRRLPAWRQSPIEQLFEWPNGEADHGMRPSSSTNVICLSGWDKSTLLKPAKCFVSFSEVEHGWCGPKTMGGLYGAEYHPADKASFQRADSALGTNIQASKKAGLTKERSEVRRGLDRTYINRMANGHKSPTINALF